MAIEHEIRAALAGKGITGQSADLLTDRIETALRRVDEAGGLSAVRDRIAAKIEAARLRLAAQ